MRGRSLLLAGAIALTTSACDLSSKRWAIRVAAGGPKHLIPGALDLVHWENPGMAFSLMRDWHPQVRAVVLSTAALVAIGAALFTLAKRPMRMAMVVAIGLIM